MNMVDSSRVRVGVRWWPELIVLLLAVFLRVYDLHKLSLCHYDEGVYVSSALRLAGRSAEGFAFHQPEHAPPLFPACVAVVFALLQVPWPNVALYVSSLFGVATVAVVYGLGRQWMGRHAGCVAALLLATSDFHIAFSRMALTDAMFSFWFTLVIVLSLASEQARLRGRRWAECFLVLAAGLAAGMAWLTKYNGWMSLLVVAAAGLSIRMRHVASGHGEPAVWSRFTHLPVRFTSLVSMVVLAFVCYAPWIWYVSHDYPGGYRGLVRIHASYLADDWREYLRHVATYMGSLAAMRHWGWLLLVIGGPLWLVRRARADWSAVVAALLWSAVLVLGSDAVWMVIALWASLEAFSSRDVFRHVLAVWFLAFCVLAPCYFPYLRLVLPALPAATLLATGTLVETFWSGSLAGGDRSATTNRTVAGVRFVVCGFLLGIWALAAQPFGLLPGRELWSRWQSTQGYQAFAAWVAASTPGNAAFLCQGQPPFAIYCPRQAVVLGNESFVAATEGLTADCPTYWAVDFRIIHEPHSIPRREMQEQIHALEWIHSVPLDLNIVTLLDYMSPRQVASKVRGTTEVVEHIQARDGRTVPLPGRVTSPGWDAIMIYCLDVGKLPSGPR